MEQDLIGGVLGTVLGAIGALSEPGASAVTINRAAPADFRPLRLETPGQDYDFHPSEIRGLSVVQDFDGQPGLDLRFGPDAAQWLVTATSANVGKPMTMSICERELMAPVIREPILAGQVRISGNFDLQEIHAATAVIAGHIDCEGHALAGASTGKPVRRGGGRN